MPGFGGIDFKAAHVPFFQAPGGVDESCAAGVFARALQRFAERAGNDVALQRRMRRLLRHVGVFPGLHEFTHDGHGRIGGLGHHLGDGHASGIAPQGLQRGGRPHDRECIQRRAAPLAAKGFDEVQRGFARQADDDGLWLAVRQLGGGYLGITAIVLHGGGGAFIAQLPHCHGPLGGVQHLFAKAVGLVHDGDAAHTQGGQVLDDFFCFFGVAGADIEHVALCHTADLGTRQRREKRYVAALRQGQHGSDVGRAKTVEQGEGGGVCQQLACVGHGFVHLVAIIQRVQCDRASMDAPACVDRCKRHLRAVVQRLAQIGQWAAERRGLPQHNLPVWTLGPGAAATSEGSHASEHAAA